MDAVDNSLDIILWLACLDGQEALSFARQVDCKLGLVSLK
jgi:hypothetical protein